MAAPGLVDAAEPPRYATDPVGVVSDIVLSIEVTLDRRHVHQTVTSVVTSRRGRRELARELQANPALLTDGRSHGLRSVELLIPALFKIGARHLVRPRCPCCGHAKRLTVRSGDERICRSCSIAAQPPCTGCGNRRYVALRDHLGRPHCQYCQPEQSLDPVTMICEVIRQIAPAFPREKAIAAIEDAIPHAFQRSRTAAALADNPALLIGQGAHGTPRIIALIDSLLAAGAEGILRPRCPSCGSDSRPLRYTLDGLRCCKRCYAETNCKALCVGCQRHMPIAGRDLNDRPLCNNCMRHDRSYHGECAACREIRFLFHLGDRLCRSCVRRPAATCSGCGKTKPCYGISTGQPRCDACAVKLRPLQACSHCSKTRRVYARGPDGEPLCTTCGELKEPCRDCRTSKPVYGRSAGSEALCRSCYAKDPISIRECLGCGQVCRLFHHGLCNSCALQSVVHNLLSDPGGQIHPDREPLCHALLSGNPRSALAWLQRTRTRSLVAALLATNKPIGHQTLDELVPDKAVQHLRAILVTNGALPPRDEHLAALERQLPNLLADIATASERSLVKSFVTWHNLRRLRQASKRQMTSYGQLAAARRDITAVVKLLAWLRARHLTLATCTQADIDLWLDQGPRWEREAPRTFVRWAAKHHHCGPIEIPVTPIPRTHRTIEDDERLHMIQKLLHDDDLDLTIRVAGLFLLLFGQPLSRIVRIATSDVIQADDKLTVALGPEPLELPPPLDALVLRLRDAPASNHRTATRPRQWLFTGHTRPGHQLSSRHLGHRLKQLGIDPRPIRNTALIELAAELPATVFAKLLGLHPNTATAWNSRAGSPRAEYAADLARKEEFREDR